MVAGKQCWKWGVNGGVGDTVLLFLALLGTISIISCLPATLCTKPQGLKREREGWELLRVERQEIREVRGWYFDNRQFQTLVEDRKWDMMWSYQVIRVSYQAPPLFSWLVNKTELHNRPSRERQVWTSSKWTGNEPRRICTKIVQPVEYQFCSDKTTASIQTKKKDGINWKSGSKY